VKPLAPTILRAGERGSLSAREKFTIFNFQFLFLVASVVLLTISAAFAQVPLPTAKPVPQLQALPLPNDEISFQRDGVELARYHYSTNLLRPFIYPVNGPTGRSLTRMGHPHDQQSHKHHYSVWISHHDVNGVSFWDEKGAGVITHQVLEKIEDGDRSAYLVVQNAWKTNGVTVLLERRQVTVQDLPNREWLLIIDLHLESPKGEVTLGETAFGLLGARLAKTIGVLDGGGLIRNSEGAQDEAGTFRKPAKWVDYSGPILTGVNEGLTLMDHPANYNHPSAFHTRADGWMGAALTFGGPKAISPGQPVVLRYGLYVHGGVPEPAKINKIYEDFAQTKRPDLSQRQK